MPSTELPSALEAEKAVLGSVLLNNLAYDQAIGLAAEDFYLDANRRIFAAIAVLRERNHPADLITLPDYLASQKELEAIGGVSYIASLTNFGVRGQISQHVKIIRDKASARRLIEIAEDAKARALDQSDPIVEVFNQTEARLFEISHARQEREFATPGQIIRETYPNLNDFYQRGNKSRGLQTPFHRLNDITGGFRKKNLVIIAGRPSMGKTACAMNIAESVAVEQHKNVGVFSMEMGREDLLDRMACSLAGVNLYNFQTGFVGRETTEKIQAVMTKLVEAPLLIDDTPGLTVMQLRAKARKLARAMGHLDLIVVDYLQLMSGGKKGENRTQEVSAISRGLKMVAMELNCPMIAISQLNRATETRTGDKEPILSDLRESGSIEQDADVVMFCHRPEYYDRKNESLKGIAKFIVAKQRNGPVDAVDVKWEHEYVRFANL